MIAVVNVSIVSDTSSSELSWAVKWLSLLLLLNSTDLLLCFYFNFTV